MKKILLYLSIVSVAVFPIAALLKRLDVLSFMPAFSMIKYSVFLAFGVVVLSLLGVFFCKGKKPLVFAFLLSAIPAIWGLCFNHFMNSIPFIHNVSTDVNDPPEFDAIVKMRAPTDNDLYYDSESIASLQQKAYPEVKTLITKIDLQNSYQRAEQVAKLLDWKIIAKKIDSETGAALIEATHTSSIWAFSDDIAIRLRTEADKSITIDLRSVSRVGKSDLGANAKRITHFIRAFNAQ